MDQSLNNLCKIHEWLHFYDQLHQRILSSQEWELMAYTAYAIVPWHSHLASSANMDRPVEYPKADYEVSGSRNRLESR
jgi:chromosome transmission fidelity protein 18